MARVVRGLSKTELFFASASFLPFVGLIFSMAAFVLGASKLKNGGKKLLMVALIGLGFSVTVSALLLPWSVRHMFRWSFSGKVSSEIEQSMNREHLHDTVVAIEYYRLIHGQYPAALSLLDGHGGYYLRDYSGGIDVDKVHNYHQYQLQPDGQHYRLFDVGPDGLSGTADDVSPVLSPEELARTGWMASNPAR